MEIEFLLKILPYLFQAITAYVGVRIALAEIRTEQKTQDRDIEKHDERITWLERNHPHFERKR